MKKKRDWRTEGEALEPKDFVQPVEHSGGSIMLWDSFTDRANGAKHRGGGTVNEDIGRYFQEFFNLTKITKMTLSYS